MIFNKREGNTLIEVLIAISVCTIALVAIVSLATRSTALTGMASRQSRATNLAAAAMEEVRSEKESGGWSTFATNHPAGTYTYGTSGWGSNCVMNTEYCRRVILAYSNVSGKDQLTVTVEVVYSESGDDKTVTQSVVYTRY